MGMAYNFIPVNRDQPFLIPPSLRDWLAKFQALKAELETRSRSRKAPKGRRSQASSSAVSSDARDPAAPDEPDPDTRINLTDPESRILKGRHGFVQKYNAQAVVTVQQFVFAGHVTDQANDVHQLHPMLSAARRNLRMAGRQDGFGTAVADAGYWSKRNFRLERSTRLLIATKKAWKLRREQRDTAPPRGRIPQGMGEAGRMECRLMTKEGQRLYKLRG